jgi:hypothetical protein
VVLGDSIQVAAQEWQQNKNYYNNINVKEKIVPHCETG